MELAAATPSRLTAWIRRSDVHTYPQPPFKMGARITTGYSRAHRAKDFAPRNDDDGQVFAMEGGTVTDVEDGLGAGDDNANMVIVQGTDTALTVYAHVYPTASPNDRVARGDKLGDVDLSGQSSARHVHLVRLPAGTGSVDDVLLRLQRGVFYAASVRAW
jgi:murein DD-endopeptidase MepM/ murein hydrolase activator NlpD